MTQKIPEPVRGSQEVTKKPGGSSVERQKMVVEPRTVKLKPKEVRPDAQELASEMKSLAERMSDGSRVKEFVTKKHLEYKAATAPGDSRERRSDTRERRGDKVKGGDRSSQSGASSRSIRRDATLQLGNAVRKWTASGGHQHAGHVSRTRETSPVVQRRHDSRSGSRSSKGSRSGSHYAGRRSGVHHKAGGNKGGRRDASSHRSRSRSRERPMGPQVTIDFFKKNAEVQAQAAAAAAGAAGGQRRTVEKTAPEEVRLKRQREEEERRARATQSGDNKYGALKKGERR